MSEQTLDYENVDTYKAGSMIDGTQQPYAKCLLCGFPSFRNISVDVHSFLARKR